jgi:hypothetical protein
MVTARAVAALVAYLWRASRSAVGSWSASCPWGDSVRRSAARIHPTPTAAQHWRTSQTCPWRGPLLLLRVDDQGATAIGPNKCGVGNPNPKWVALPGTSLHRYAELDLGSAGGVGVAGGQRRLGFIRRYAWVSPDLWRVVSHSIGGSGQSASIILWATSDRMLGSILTSPSFVANASGDRMARLVDEEAGEQLGQHPVDLLHGPVVAGPAPDRLSELQGEVEQPVMGNVLGHGGEGILCGPESLLRTLQLVTCAT